MTVSNVATAFIGAGLGVPLLLCGLLGLLVWKDAAGVNANLARLIDQAASHGVLGWVLFGLALAGWYVHFKTLTRWYREEIQRISEERNRLQQRLSPGPVPSSESKEF